MSLSHTQALVTVTVSGYKMTEAVEKLHQALLPYPDARIVAITQKMNWMGAFFGSTTLLAVIEHTQTETAV